MIQETTFLNLAARRIVASGDLPELWTPYAAFILRTLNGHSGKQMPLIEGRLYSLDTQGPPIPALTRRQVGAFS
jgi:hypothetical protein